jgi:hypothetical protein
MPNWCINTLTIVGHKEDLDLFEETRLEFNYFIPRPIEEEENWYGWNREHWGTKWSHRNFSLKIREENLLVVEFDTAWSPPFAFLRALLGKYSRCWMKNEFTIEDGMAGILVGYYKNGGLIEKAMTWIEPMPCLDCSGNIYVPED